MRDDLDEKIVALRSQGLSFNKIAKRLGVPYTTLFGRAKKIYTAEERRYEPTADKFTAADVNKLIAMYESGTLYVDIGRELGRTYEQVYRKICVLRRDGRISGTRRAVPKKYVKYVKRDSHDDGEETPAEIMTETVRRYVLANPGCHEREIAADTGYGWASVREELRRLQRFDEPIVVRVKQRGWYLSEVADLALKQPTK